MLFYKRLSLVPLSSQQTVSLSQVIQNVLQLFEPQAKAKGITLTSPLLDGISVRGEATQLKRLFSNLLDNAVKYTAAEGSVVVSLTKKYWFAVVTLSSKLEVGSCFGVDLPLYNS